MSGACVCGWRGSFLCRGLRIWPMCVAFKMYVAPDPSLVQKRFCLASEYLFVRKEGHLACVSDDGRRLRGLKRITAHQADDALLTISRTLGDARSGFFPPSQPLTRHPVDGVFGQGAGGAAPLHSAQTPRPSTAPVFKHIPAFPCGCFRPIRGPCNDVLLSQGRRALSGTSPRGLCWHRAGG